MSGNAFNVSGFASKHGPGDDMVAFDRLPREFRDLLNYAPANFGAWKIAQDIRRYGGSMDVLAFYRQQIVEAFPDWTPLSGESPALNTLPKHSIERIWHE